MKKKKWQRLTKTQIKNVEKYVQQASKNDLYDFMGCYIFRIIDKICNSVI